MLPYFIYDIRDLTKIDIALLVLSAVLALCFGAAGLGKLVLLSLLIALMLIELLHGLWLALAFRDTLPATAQIVSHDSRIMIEPGTRYRPSQEWVYWSPVVSYDTAAGSVQAKYPVYTLSKWFVDEEYCEICYSCRHPELFYVQGRRAETVWKNLIGFSIAAVVTLLYVAVMFYVFI